MPFRLLIDIICTFLQSDAGKVVVDGNVLGKDDNAIRSSIGAVFQDGLLDGLLTVRENLSIRAGFYGVRGKKLEQVLADGKRLGASHYVMHGPARLFGGVKNIGLTRIAPILVELSVLARQYDIQLTLENVSWCVFNEPEFGVRLLDAIGGDALRFTLDVKQAVRSGHDPMEYIRAVGSRIVNVHLCDATQQENDAARYAMPGAGNYDFVQMFDELASFGYQGPAFIEVYSDMYRQIPELYESYARMLTLYAQSKLAKEADFTT